MAIGSQEHANLASDSYANHLYAKQSHEGYADGPDEKLPITIGVVKYLILETVDNKKTGYQGTIYQRADTGEIVVAHRGTEFEREFVKDGLATDGGMVLARANAQADDAIALTRLALAYAEKNAAGYDPDPQVTVTGHSLGGALAQITAHYFDLKGETFNAYGAASLGMRIPAGGDSVINHVMAADIASSASQHYGQVRIYPKQNEIDALADKGYENNDHRIFDLRNPVGAVAANISSHYMENFLDKKTNGEPNKSVLSDSRAEELYREYAPMVDKHRDDVRFIRTGITTVVDVVTVQGVVRGGVNTIRGDLQPGESAELERQRQLAEKDRPAFTVPDDSMRSPAARNAAASGLFDQLYTSMKSGDDHEFKHALAKVADSDFNREFREQVVANVDAQEQRSALQAQQQQQREAEQVEAPRRSAMMH